MDTCYLAIGSNEGERIAQCEAAVAALAALPKTAVRRRSAWYETEPVIDLSTHTAEESPAWFINGVVELATDLSPLELFHDCLRVERRMGRGRIRSHKTLAQSGEDAHLPPSPSSPYGLKPPFSRPIDLDVLFYGDWIVKSSELVLPHPRLHLRRFVLAPLAELAPTLAHPTLGLTIAELLNRLTDAHRAARIAPASPPR
jgi:2-amino-4-hydroxy-6-hydroxymethyldihydropteridine diphosphokinase